MTNGKHENDEYMERLWYMKEERKDARSDFIKVIGASYDEKIVDELSAEGLIQVTDSGKKISLTEKGEAQARKLIRAHRLGERLLYDVFGGNFESGACEFEHIASPELIDSICTLLGHPKECPHGMPIPEGECCRRSAVTAQSMIAPLTELAVGRSARIAYINCRDDQRLHKMDGLCIRPGVIVKMHQNYPAYVIECEGVNVALDKEIVSNICVWKEEKRHEPAENNAVCGAPNGRKRWRMRLGNRHQT